MFNLYQIVTGAHGGQALETLSARFGISRDQADTAVKALLPALSTAFMSKAAQPGGLGEIAGAMADNQHKQAYADPDAAQDATTRQKASEVASTIFGNDAIISQVVRQAAAFTGLPEATLRQMLPTIVSMVVGGTATVLHAQGFGGMLGSLAQGGLGNVLGQLGGASGSNSGFPGMVGHIVGSLLGGNAQPQGQTGTAMPPAMQAGMDALLKMFQPGVAGQAGQTGAQGTRSPAA